MSRSLCAKKAALIQEVATQQKHINTLKSQLQLAQNNITSKSYTVALRITMIIAGATAIGLVANTLLNVFFSSKHDVQMIIHSSPENLDGPFPVKTEGKVKGSAIQ